MRLAVICDFAEENWPSMDLVADMLLKDLRAEFRGEVNATRIRPAMVRRLSHLPGLRHKRIAFSVDRLLNRFLDYPLTLARRRREFDLYHIVDHSYAHLIYRLPAEKTIIGCHDIDAFRCLLEPECEPRSKMFRMMAARILDGLGRAARVSCSSASTRHEVVAYRLTVPDRVRTIPLGVHPACTPASDPPSDAEAARLLGAVNADAPEILHVGGTVARKRIDVLLRVMAVVRQAFPKARLIRVGGPLTGSQQELSGRLNLTESILALPFLNRRLLAAVYRRAALLMQPSEREGFGLPVIEAMACGVPVVASDLPALREAGGPSTTFCPIADVPAWTNSIVELLRERQNWPERWRERRFAALGWAARFSWREHARMTVQVYKELLH
jgi:glycosyltransferase involved in cell wall biosynthesis